MNRSLSRIYPFAIMLGIILTYVVMSRGVWLIDYGGADNWSYVKYFYDWGDAPPQLRIAMDGDYKGSRLPWVVPGYLFFTIFGEILGSYLLHSTILVLTISLFYVGIKTLFDDEVAMVASSVILVNPSFHSSNIPGFWYYHEHAALLYYALAYLGVTLAAPSPHPAATLRRSLLWSFVAGVGLCSSILVSLTYLLFLPAFGLFFLILHRQASVGRLVRSGASIVVGGLAAIGGFGLLNVLVGGRFLFFWSQIEHTLRYTATGGLWLPPADWFNRSTWLAFPLAVLAGLTAIGLLLALVGRWRRSICRPRAVLLAACAAQLVVSFVVLLAGEIRGQPLLQVPYIAHQLFGPGAYALAAILAAVGRRAGAAGRWSVVAVLALAVLVPEFLVTSQQRAEARTWLTLPAVAGLPASQLWGVTGLLLLGGLALAVALWSRWLVVVLAGGAVLGVGLAIAAPPGEPYLPLAACDSRQAQFHVIHQAARWAADDPRSIGAALWYAPDEQAARPEPCPPVPLRSLYIATAQVAALQPPIASGVPGPPPGELPDHRVLNPDHRAWSWLVVASAADHAAATRARFDGWLASAPAPVPWRYSHAVDLRQDDVAVTLSVYELPLPRAARAGEPTR